MLLLYFSINNSYSLLSIFSGFNSVKTGISNLVFSTYLEIIFSNSLILLFVSNIKFGILPILVKLFSFSSILFEYSFISNLYSPISKLELFFSFSNITILFLFKFRFFFTFFFTKLIIN